MFAIEDELHSETWEGFPCLEAALAELIARSKITWNDEPNLAPCQNWENCGREYEVVEFVEDGDFHREISRVLVLSVSKEGAVWAEGFPGIDG